MHACVQKRGQINKEIKGKEYKVIPPVTSTNRVGVYVEEVGGQRMKVELVGLDRNVFGFCNFGGRGGGMCGYGRGGGEDTSSVT